MDQLLGTFFELLKNMFLTWITSPGEKDEESRKLGTVYSAKFAHFRRFAPPAVHGVSSMESGSSEDKDN